MIEEAKKQGITILPPNINESHWFYKPSQEGIYLSIGTIKGVGYQSVKVIVDERYQNGKFKDFFDFARRCTEESQNEKVT
ncbi:helix-hairpin-helix domain-containing protein [Staphylococcus aureus]